MEDEVQDEFLSYEELAKRFHVSTRTIRRDVERKRLPEPVWIGRTWSAFDSLPSYTGPALQGASQKLVAAGQIGSLAVTTGTAGESGKTL